MKNIEVEARSFVTLKIVDKQIKGGGRNDNNAGIRMELGSNRHLDA